MNFFITVHIYYTSSSIKPLRTLSVSGVQHAVQGKEVPLVKGQHYKYGKPRHPTFLQAHILFPNSLASKGG